MVTPLGALAGVAAFVLVAGLAVDDGGFGALAWDRALFGLAVVVALVGVARPGRNGGAFLAALGGLTVWTAASWLWSSSPASALVEAQRAALYLAVAAAVLAWGVRIPVLGVAAAATVVACWNLVTRLDGVGSSTGAGSEPVGYANGLALLCVLGLVLLPRLPWWAWVAALPLGATLVLQESRGAYAALAIGVGVLLAPRWRLLLVAAGIAVLLASPYLTSGHDREHYWRVALHDARAHPVLGSGAGTFVNAWTRDRDIPMQTREAHSLYIETLAELGPIGLALVLAVLAIPIAATRRPDLAAAVGAYAVAATVDFDWELAGVTAPVILLGALAVAGPQPRRAPRRVLVPAATLVAVAAALAYTGNARLAAAQDAARRGDFARARSEAHAASRWMPYSPDPWIVIGDVTHDPAAYRRAIELDPADWILWQRLADVSSGQPRRLARARAAQLNPLGVGR